MSGFTEFIGSFENIIPFLRTIIVVIIFLIVFNFTLRAVTKNMLKLAKTKKQISNIEIFSLVIKYVAFLVLILFAIFSYSGSWTGLGLTVGLLSAALGWALQKPITGIAAWIMVVTKRPFEIGDRIIIGSVRGDVADISLTHIYIREIGGIISSEENSGRIIMVPNSVLFEQNIINYTYKNEYVLDQVVVAVTYESNVDKAIKITVESAKKHTKEVIDATKKEPYALTYFQPSGINIHIRYFSPARRLHEVCSEISKEIYDKIMKTKDVEIAYPHTEVLFRKKRSGRQ